MRKVAIVTVAALAFVTSSALADYAEYINGWGSGGSAPGQFQKPRGVAVAHDGTVYVADTMNHRLQYFKKTEDGIVPVGRWGSYSSTDRGKFNRPFGVAVAPNGIVYVADTYNHRIQYFEPKGDYIGMWGSPSEFDRPHGVAVAPNGHVYVADTHNHRIQYFKVTDEGVVRIGEWGSPNNVAGTELGEFDQPRGVAVAANGNVYVADTGNHRIQCFTATGKTIGEWSAPPLSSPSGVAVAPNGDVYVADTDNHLLQRFSAAGKPLGNWRPQGSPPGKFELPHGVAVGPEGVVYVADTNNNRIEYFTPCQQWEYYATYISPTGLGVPLNEAGEIGWELVTTIYVSDPPDPESPMCCIFKRPLRP